MEFNLLNFNKENLSRIKKNLFFLIIICSFIQLIISSFDIKVFYILVLVIISCLITVNLMTEENLKYYLIPSFIALSLNISCLLGPLIFKTILFQKITSNLNFPLITFYNFTIYQIIIFASFLSLKYFKIFKFTKKNFLIKLKIFESLSEKKIIIFLVFIFGIRFYTGYIDQGPSQNIDQGNILIRILEGMEKFFYIPILFFLYNNLRKSAFDNKFIIIFSIYFLYSIFLSLSLNQRSHFFEFLFVILFLILISSFYFKFKNKKFIFFTFILVIFIIPYLSKTILVNREFKDELSASDLISKSVKKNKYIEYKLKSITDESYTENAIIDRFVLIKYFDRSYSISKDFSDNNKFALSEFTKSRIISVLPQNFINLFIDGFDKRNYMISMGSFTERINGINGGNYSIGSFLMESKLLFDNLNWVVIYFLFLFLFIFFQHFQIIKENKIVYSYMPFILILELYHLSMSDSIVDFFYIFRTFVQYAILYFLITIFLKLIKNYES